jgi:hypothetical protein
VAVSAEDRRRWERQVAGLREMENDDEGTPEWRRSVEETANRWRAAHGIPPLEEWWEEKTEPEFYELARARGLLRPVR